MPLTPPPQQRPDNVTPAVQPPSDARPEPAISISGLDVHLGGVQILHGIGLTVNRGEVLAVLGANGSGKSTLVKALVRSVPTSGGHVELLGAPLGRRVPWNRIGYVPQRVGAQSGITASAQEIVASGLLGPGRLRKPRDWTARTHEALDRVGLAHRAQSAIHELSGGQQQRVLIARALVRNPDLLFLDEPVAGVDHKSQLNFAVNLRELIRQGVTIVVVLHELGDFADLITRTIVLDQGRISRDGGPQPGTSSRTGEHVHPHCEPTDSMPSSVLPEPIFDGN